MKLDWQHTDDVNVRILRHDAELVDSAACLAAIEAIEDVSHVGQWHGDMIPVHKKPQCEWASVTSRVEAAVADHATTVKRRRRSLRE